ncbi:Twin-arginine translocation pathway signal [Nocardia nova]|uniref:Twin-arginine translocation pathway signal n=1 Tax=Nocardia nova TaxID=37330 RepID=A0A2S6AL94_9NOCA|nr:helix-turn-helix transcriptional regulator [Nocardia nova]PPJ31747.1 Twin-arginine translocation pathway signal [Nocardia nova]PPJ35986.1 Twin-arginine translocation pathway signal [Nocardia nova]
MTIVKWTGLEVAALRTALRDTQIQFADRIGCSLEAVGKWERRGADITLGVKYAECMDTACGRLDDEQRARFDAALQNPDATLQTARTEEFPPSGAAVVLGAQEVDKVRRRDFGSASIRLPALVAGVVNSDMSAAHIGVSHFVCGDRVAPELVDYFHSQLSGHYTADMYLGPLYLIPTVRAQTELIDCLAATADTPVRCGLLEIGTAYAAFLGWLYQDAGDRAASAKWRDTTLSLAHRSGSPDLISYALSNMAMLALDNGDARTVVDLARAARAAGLKLSPKVRVIALQHEAQGHAMLGDRVTAERLLDDAVPLIDHIDDVHPWGNSCRRTPHHMEVQRATCYGRTGSLRDAMDAAILWDEIMDSMPESARRDNAVFRARQSAVLARVPDPDRSVWAAAEAVEAVRVTGSARLRGELKEIAYHARAWADTSAGHELSTLVGSVA